MTAQIRFDQVGLSAGINGSSRSDGKIDGSRVTVTNTSGKACRCQWWWKPHEDTAATLTQTSGPTWYFDSTPDIPGDFAVTMIEDEGLPTETRDTKVFTIRYPITGITVPPFNCKGVEDLNLSSTNDEKQSAIVVSHKNENLPGASPPLRYTAYYGDMRGMANAIEQLSMNNQVVVYQPGLGVGEKWNVCSEFTLLQEFLRKRYFYANPVGVSKLIIDGQLTGGFIEWPSSIELYGYYDVEFVNTRAVVCADTVFYNPRCTVSARNQVIVSRSNTVGSYFVRRDQDVVAWNTKIENIIWDASGNSSTNVQPMVRSDTGCPRFEFWNCSLQQSLDVPRAADKLLWIQQTAPNSLTILWMGQMAGRLSQGNTQFMFTNLTGFATTFYYGAFGGSMLTLPSISWTATAPTLISRQP